MPASWGGTLVLELYRHYPEQVATLILVDTYAGWKRLAARGGGAPGSRPRDGVLAASPEEPDPTPPGLFASATPTEFVPLMAEMAAVAREQTVRLETGLMAETDQRDLLPLITSPTLLIWGELDVRSPPRASQASSSA